MRATRTTDGRTSAASVTLRYENRLVEVRGGASPPPPAAPAPGPPRPTPLRARDSPLITLEDRSCVLVTVTCVRSVRSCLVRRAVLGDPVLQGGQGRLGRRVGLQDGLDALDHGRAVVLGGQAGEDVRVARRLR